LIFFILKSYEYCVSLRHSKATLIIRVSFREPANDRAVRPLLASISSGQTALLPYVITGQRL